jgi:hypothetical protein
MKSFALRSNLYKNTYFTINSLHLNMTFSAYGFRTRYKKLSKRCLFSLTDCIFLVECLYIFTRVTVYFYLSVRVSTEQPLSLTQGDVYGFMIEHYVRYVNCTTSLYVRNAQMLKYTTFLYRSKQYKPAYLLIEDMKARIPKVNVVYYVNLQTVR